MSEGFVLYDKKDGIATITLNRPSKANTLRFEVIEGLDACLKDANADPNVKVIVLEGNGDNFCGGFDFSGGLEHYEGITEEGYDPGYDPKGSSAERARSVRKWREWFDNR